MTPVRAALFVSLCALPVAAQLGAQLGAQSWETYQGRTVVARQAFVKFRTPNAATTEAVRQSLDADSVRQVGGASGPLLYHSRSQGAAQLMTSLTRRADVLYAEPDFVVQAVTTPNDSAFSQLWGMNQIGAPSAWDVSTGSAAVVAAIVDTGVNYTHPDLAANIWTAPSAFTVNLSTGSITCPAGSHGYNAVAHSCDPLDDNGHGTHVAGIIGAVGNNGVGVAGVNWTTRVMALKFLNAAGSGSTSDAVDAMEFAIQAKTIFGANASVRVLSNSWGGSGYSTTLFNEILRASASGILFVAAAGNTTSNNDATPFYPADYNVANMIAVAATDVSDSLAGFSNFGKQTVHLGAPGVNILSTYQSGYAFLSGTSMATPHVSGAAALVAAACGTDMAATKSAILNNVDPVVALSSATVSGGRLNVNRAVRSCIAPTTPPPAPTTPPATYTGIWNGAAVTPAIQLEQPGSITVGVKFRSDVAGTVTGVRFYKGSSANSGTHVGLLYSYSGAVLAQATFTGETSSGWQSVTFSTPVSILANTTYVAAYWTNSGYSRTPGQFTNSGVDNAPLHALQAWQGQGPNGVYSYGGAPSFPTDTYQNSGYWVDVVFTTGTPAPAPVPDPPPPPPPPPSTSTLSIWGSTVSPAIPYVADAPVTVGMKFRSDVAGSVTGVRFWKGDPQIGGTHIGLLYTLSGQLLAQATFTNETSSGWQTVTFATPVAMAANTTYVAAYWTGTGYSRTPGLFTSQPVDNAPLHGLQSWQGQGPNGVFAYGGAPRFPDDTYQNSHYWVDVLVTVP